MIPNMTKFYELIPHLESGRIEAIEYGDPEHSGGFRSLLRIRYLMTPGGMQFCIKFLHNGMEGSGIYFPGRITLHDHLLCYIDRYYQKPVPATIGRFLRERHLKLADRPLDFFIYTYPKNGE